MIKVIKIIDKKIYKIIRKLGHTETEKHKFH